MHLFASSPVTTGGMRAFTKTALIMKLTLVMLCTCLWATASEVRSQSITLKTRGALPREVIAAVEKQVRLVFVYDETLMIGTSPITIDASDMPVRDFLSRAFAGQPFSWLIENQTVVLKRRAVSVDNSPDLPVLLIVSGNVKDGSGVPIKGVSVSIKGTQQGTVTDETGHFFLNAEVGQVLVFSSVEYQTREIKITAAAKLDNVVLEKKVTDMEEVVVNKGYYSESRKVSTGSVGRVSGETINKQPVTNVMGALIGRVPGLEITQAGGIPGAGFKVRIRGQNSIAAGNNPLFIVDGVPFSSESLGHNYVGQQLPFIDGNIAVSPFNVLNPADIANIEVLKDADATAIYGSRGSNGVILITTKKGKAGETKYEMTINSGMSQITRPVEMVGTEEYIALRKKAFELDGLTTYPDDAYDVNGTWDQSRNTDWQKELIGGTAKSWNIQAGVSGGSETTQFLIRAGVQKETTVYPGDFHYDRGSMLVNLNHRSANGAFKLNFTANYSTDNNNMLNSDVTSKAFWLVPNAPALYNADGTLNWADGTWENPLAALYGSYDGKNRNINTNLVMDIRLVGDLIFKTSMGFSDYRLNEYMITPSTIYNPIYEVGSENSYVWSNNGHRENWIVEPQLNWKKEIGNGTLMALAGATLQQNSSNRSGVYGDNFPSNSLLHDVASAGYQWSFLNDNKLYKYQAVFGRLNYNLHDKYLLNFTARRDGSSRFSPEHQFANFGAVGAAWIFSNEHFARKRLSFLSFGKFRGSYGITGNDQIGDYQFLNTYGTSGTNYQGVVGLVPQRLYNPDFGWESNKKLEAAVELGFFNDRLFLITSWYRNRSSNQLVGIPLSGITGFTSIQSNLAATVQNTGWEFELQASIVSSKKFNWRSSVNISFPRNKLVSFPGLEQSSYSTTYVVGEPLSIAKRYHMKGIDPTTGIYQYEDVNKDGQLSTAHDRIFLRNLASQYFGGINNTFTLGKLQLDVFVQFVKSTGYNYLYWIGSPGAYPSAILKDVADKIWEPGRTDATIQVQTAGANQAALNAWEMLYRSDAAISDYYFARLKNVSLSYTLPENWIQKLQARVFMQAQNLVTITNYVGADPEVGSLQNLGPLRTITFGLQLNF